MLVRYVFIPFSLTAEEVESAKASPPLDLAARMEERIAAAHERVREDDFFYGIKCEQRTEDVYAWAEKPRRWSP